MLGSVSRVMFSGMLADRVTNRTNDESTHTSIIGAVLFVLYVVLHFVLCVACYVSRYLYRDGKQTAPMMEVRLLPSPGRVSWQNKIMAQILW